MSDDRTTQRELRRGRLTKERAVELASYIDLKFEMEYGLTQSVDEHITQRWRVSADIELADPDSFPKDEVELVSGHVGVFRLAKFNIFSTSRIIRSLDDHDGELFDLVEQLVDPRLNGDLAPALEKRLEPFGSWALVLETAETTDQWRGTGIGKLLAGTAVRALLPGCRFAALQASPLRQRGRDDLPSADERTAKRKLAANWRKLGFRNFKNGILVLDAGSVDLDRALKRLRHEYQVDD